MIIPLKPKTIPLKTMIRPLKTMIFCMFIRFSLIFEISRIFSLKSLYRSRAGRHFYPRENEIWVGFGPVGNTEKKLGADYEPLRFSYKF